MWCSVKSWIQSIKNSTLLRPNAHCISNTMIATTRLQTAFSEPMMTTEMESLREVKSWTIWSRNLPNTWTIGTRPNCMSRLTSSSLERVLNVQKSQLWSKSWKEKKKNDCKNLIRNTEGTINKWLYYKLVITHLSNPRNISKLPDKNCLTKLIVITNLHKANKLIF